MGTQLWIYGLPHDKSAGLRLLKRLSYEVVTVGRDKETVKAILCEGLRAHVALGAFSVGGKDLQGEEVLVRCLDGKSAKWFGSGCPNNLKVRAASLGRARETASIDGVEALILDGIRFASSGEGIETFMTCFCNECRNKASELGYNMSEMEASLRGLLKSIRELTPSIFDSISNWKNPIDLLNLLFRFPGVLDWLKFRADCIVEHVVDVKKVVRSVNPHCKLGAYLFTPSLSYLVGQDYRQLTRLLDYVEPMVYRTGKGVACLNFELAKMATDICERGSGLDPVEVQRFLLNFLGIDAEPETNIKKLEKGISFRAVESETRKAMKMVDVSKLIPILFLDDYFLKESVIGALKAGVQNLSLFIFSDGAENNVKAIAEIVKQYEAR